MRLGWLKTLVYKLAEHINKINNRHIIPSDVISRPPTAELRANQKDTDSLPDYDLLDEILKGYVEEDKSAKELAETGLNIDDIDQAGHTCNFIENHPIAYYRRQQYWGRKMLSVLRCLQNSTVLKRYLMPAG